MQLNNKHLPPIHQHQFNEWRNDPVTEHLFRDLENIYFDSVIDPLPVKLSALTVEALKREGRREFIDIVLDWIPNGLTEDD